MYVLRLTSCADLDLASPVCLLTKIFEANYVLKSGTLRLAVSAKNARSEKPGNGTLYKPTWSYSEVPRLKMFAFAAHLALVKGQIAERARTS